MNINPIKITESKANDKLIFKKSLFDKLSDLMVEIPIIVFIPFLCGFALFKKISDGEPFVGTLFLFILFLSISVLMIYSMSTLNSLERITGKSRGQNSKAIKEIAEFYNWKIYSNNQQMTIISFSWKETGTDWGKQMTILYDKEDILVNCTSYGLFSTPSPFHWFANRKKVNKLKSEFNKRIKNALQQRV